MGYPDGFASPANFSTVNTKTVYIPKDIRMPYVQNWHFTIQRELAKTWFLMSVTRGTIAWDSG